MTVARRRIPRSSSSARTMGPCAFALTGLLLLASPPLVSAGPPFGRFVDPNPRDGNQFGVTVVALSTGNVVVTSPNDDTTARDAGAVYVFNGATGALLSTLTGATPEDRIGSGGVVALGNGHFVVVSPLWDNGLAKDAGAVTWGHGGTGITGVVSASNSIVGTTAGDFSDSRGAVQISPLPNGSYVISAPYWDQGSIANAGAATFALGTIATTGVISGINSLMGSTAGDAVGTSVVVLTNGNYVVVSPSWDNGAVVDVGAATWASASGLVGPVSAANSLVGSLGSDRVGSGGVTPLTNGNYVVRSGQWDGKGAATWGNGTVGITGPIGSSNSLMGVTGSAGVASGSVVALTNGNYVVVSPAWSTSAGAVTWGNGAAGTVGTVSSSNSMVGGASSLSHFAGGGGVTPLSNGNYVISSPQWNNTPIAGAGAATWGDGTSGSAGVVGPSNSLIGLNAFASVSSGGVIALTNGNYVVGSPSWRNGSADAAGAATWGSGTTGIAGAVSTANSLVGSTALDQLGSIIVPLSNGNYVVNTPYWTSGATTNAGAVTFGSGTSGITGVPNTSNSLIGSRASDQVGWGGVTPLSNGNYVISSPYWDRGAVEQAGAVTWANGVTGTSGVITETNSLVGVTAGDLVGATGAPPKNGVTALSTSHYVVSSSWFRQGTSTDVGAVTWGDGVTGTSGFVSAANSILGGVPSSNLQLVATDNVNKTFFARFLNEGGGSVRLGSQIDGIVPSSSQTAQAITFGAAPTVSVFGTGTLAATSTSALPVTFTSLTLQTCAVTGSTIHGIGGGPCTIAANQGGSAVFAPAPQATQTFTIGSSAIPRLVNISTRGPVQTGDNVMIGGFIVGGTEPKKVLIRGRGPSLADFSVPGLLADPSIRLFAGSTEIASNDNWQNAANAADIPAALALTRPQESAIYTTVSPGLAYTVHLAGVSNTTGIGLVEVFETDRPDIPLLNISTRGRVGTGDDVLIGGFIVQGTSPQRVLIVAKGPSLGLAPFNVPGALADTTLDLYSGSSVIESNDNWGDSAEAAAIQASGNGPTRALESAILRTLAPGAYTAIVRGRNGATGVGLVEVYAK